MRKNFTSIVPFRYTIPVPAFKKKIEKKEKARQKSKTTKIQKSKKAKKQNNKKKIYKNAKM